MDTLESEQKPLLITVRDTQVERTESERGPVGIRKTELLGGHVEREISRFRLLKITFRYLGLFFL